jgi:hypothetical protein
MVTDVIKVTDKIVSDKVIIREMDLTELQDFIATITDAELIKYATFQLKSFKS